MAHWPISDIVVITNPVSTLVNSSSDGLDTSEVKQAYPYEGCCQHTRMYLWQVTLHLLHVGQMYYCLISLNTPTVYNINKSHTLKRDV